MDIPEIDFSFEDDELIEDDNENFIEKDNLQYKISIDCDDEKHQIVLIQKIEELGIICKPLIL